MRISWLSGALVLLSAHINAEELSQIVTQDKIQAGISLTQCAAIEDKLERLICYDTLAAHHASSHQTSTHEAADQTVNQTTNQITAEQTPPATNEVSRQDEFGVLQKKSAQLSKLTASIDSVKKDPYGSLRIRLNNGQVWKQTDTRRYKLVAGDDIVIKRGALSSFLLGVADRNGTIRVKRLE